ncbi:hypothetical protein [Pseudomonas savastanoi]|uniref:Uncharacterized protein n=1 Tax=Pseudomonas savastanoi TaxID=29438 RepID=A0AAW3LYS6_PSESS|nr:hypothetical protein [Pseudomonas savastanoi]KTC59105.1 hypothetical protein AO287_21675 [Pseudomonas savastanoi]
MLALPVDPHIYKVIEDFLRVLPERGARGSFRRTVYKEARNTFLNEVIRLRNLSRIIDFRKFIGAAFVLGKTPGIYRARHSYMTEYQIVRLVGEVGVVNSKVFVEAFKEASRQNRKALLEVERYLDMVSSGKTYSKDSFNQLRLRYG